MAGQLKTDCTIQLLHNAMRQAAGLQAELCATCSLASVQVMPAPVLAPEPVTVLQGKDFLAPGLPSMPPLSEGAGIVRACMCVYMSGVSTCRPARQMQPLDVLVDESLSTANRSALEALPPC